MQHVFGNVEDIVFLTKIWKHNRFCFLLHQGPPYWWKRENILTVMILPSIWTDNLRDFQFEKCNRKSFLIELRTTQICMTEGIYGIASHHYGGGVTFEALPNPLLPFHLYHSYKQPSKFCVFTCFIKDFHNIVFYQ